MKIAILNECFLSNDNIAYLKSIGDVEMFNDTTDEATAISRIAGKDIVLVDMFECPLNTTVMAAATSLRLLCLNTTGFDLVAGATKSANIAVANTPGYGTEAVAEHVFALLLSLNRHIIECDRAVREKPFQINPTDQAHRKFLGFSLFGKTLGIIGLGAIGSHVAKIAHGFGMEVIGYNRTPKTIPNVNFVSLDDLFARSDIISLHTPLNESSQSIISEASIAKMKKGVIIINTSREGCIVSDDLAAALKDGTVGAAGLDVIDGWTHSNALLSTPNTIVTPHSAWFTQQALDKIGEFMTDNVRAFVEGKPQNIVSHGS